MTAEIKSGNLVITIPAVTKDMKQSGSGKTLIIASTGGNVASSAVVNGSPVIIGLNAYIKNPDYVRQPKA